MKLLVGYLAVVLVVWYSLPSQSHACSCSASAIDQSIPADGATAVPLNAALELLGAFEHDSIAVRDASGRAVEITVTAGPTPACVGTSAAVVPTQLWRPETTYVVSVRPLYPDLENGPDSFTFTTGTELLPDDEPQVPEGAASVVFDVPADGQSCGSGAVAACVGLQDARAVEVLALRGEHSVLRWVLRGNHGGAFKLVDEPECVELRRITATGRRSAPLRICGAELRSRSFRASDRHIGFLRCSGGVIGPTGTANDLGPDAGSSPRPEPADLESGGSSAMRSDDALDSAGGSTHNGCALVSTSSHAPSGALLLSIGLVLRIKRRRFPARH
jgi:hypothetical protein